MSQVAGQLGGRRSFDVVAEHDASDVPPGGPVIERMIPNSPALHSARRTDVLRGQRAEAEQRLACQLYTFLHSLPEEEPSRSNVALAQPKAVPPDVARSTLAHIVVVPNDVSLKPGKT